MQGFIHGSGGLPLNFRVVGGTTQPASTKENTIWVNTDQEITGWMFIATEPTEPAEGVVWFRDGDSSEVAFNALKKNSLYVYPMECKQYVSGAWVSKDAKSYQGGAWVDWWNGMFYGDGNQYVQHTGGWEELGTGNSEIREDCLYVAGSSSGVCTTNTVDTKNFSTLHFQMEVVSKSGDYDLTIGLKTAKNVSSSIWSAKTSLRGMLPANGTVVEFTVDTSAYKGMYYIAASSYASVAVKILKVWMT